MHVDQFSWTESDGWSLKTFSQPKPDLVLYFGSRQVIASGAPFNHLKLMCPGAAIVGCSTGGQIQHNDVVDDKVCAVALAFEATNIRLAQGSVGSAAESLACGRAIGEQLQSPDLAGIFVLSDGG